MFIIFLLASLVFACLFLIYNLRGILGKKNNYIDLKEKEREIVYEDLTMDNDVKHMLDLISRKDEVKKNRDK